MRSSDRSLPVRDSRRAWWRSRASRMGRLMAPLRMWASVSPFFFLVSISFYKLGERDERKEEGRKRTTRFCDLAIMALAKFCR